MSGSKGFAVRCAVVTALVAALCVPLSASAETKPVLLAPRSGPEVTAAAEVETFYVNGHDAGDCALFDPELVGDMAPQAGVEMWILDAQFRDAGSAVNMEGLLYNPNASGVENITITVYTVGASGSVLRSYTRTAPPYVGDQILYPDEYTTYDVTVPIYSDEYGVRIFASASTCAKMPSYLGGEAELVMSPVERYEVELYNPTDYVLGDIVVNVHEWDAETGETISVYQTTASDMAPGATQTLTLPYSGYPYPDDIGWVVWSQGVKPTTADTTMTRLQGTSRYATATQIVGAAFSDSASSTAVLVSGKSYPDALSASALAGVCDAPILLVPGDTVDAVLGSELDRLGVRTAYIIGSAVAVSSTFETNLRAYLDDDAVVERIFGMSRYDTCAAVVSKAAEINGAPFTEAFVTRGDNFPDALAASPFAFSQKMPILLVKPTQAPGAILDVADDTGISALWVLGGTNAVSNTAAGAFGLPYDRLEGGSRYETGEIIALTGFLEGWTDFSTVGFARGDDFPDALAAGPALGKVGGAQFLTTPKLLSAEAGWGVQLTASNIDDMWIFGSPIAVSSWTSSTAYYLGK